MDRKKTNHVPAALAATVMILLAMLPAPAFTQPGPAVILTGMDPGPGWIPEEDPFVVSDEASLSMVINGAAPRYMELGLVYAGFANYERDGTFLMLELFQAGTRDNALAFFREFETGRAHAIRDTGDQARLTQEMGGSFMLEFISDEFYARISMTRTDETARKEIIHAARTLAARIAEY